MKNLLLQRFGLRRFCSFSLLARFGVLLRTRPGTVIAWGIALGVSLVGSGWANGAVLTNADPAALVSAVESGGVVTLAFDGILTLSQPLLISKDTVLDAGGHSVALDGANATRHFVVVKGVRLHLANLSLINGRVLGAHGQANEGGSIAQGGSILNIGGTVELVSCTISNNQAIGGNAGPNTGAGSNVGGRAWGGAVYSDGGTVSAASCLFVTNTCVGGIGSVNFTGGSGAGGDAWGGALCVTNSALSLSGVQFTNNLVRGGEYSGGRTGGGGGSAHGGALAADLAAGSTNALRECVFAANRAVADTKVMADIERTDAYGGALFCGSGRLRIGGTLFTNNVAQGGGGWATGGYPYYGNAYGGAVFNQGQLEIANSALASNEANGGSLPSNCCDFNFAYAGNGQGGAIYNRGALSLINSTLAQNRAAGGTGAGSIGYPGTSSGGAILNAGNGSLVNATVAGNFALIPSGPTLSTPQGSAVCIVSGQMTLTNSILQSSPGETNVWGSSLDGGHNIGSDGSANFTSSSSRNNTDPLLGSLADNGGLTPTMALLPGSPAIDAGDDAAGPPADQRGVGRPAGLRSDIGAFEFVFAGPPGITTPPTNLTVGAGQTAVFSLLVDTLEPSYRWQFSRGDLPAQTNATLTLANVQLPQAGDYAVVVSNASGSVTSAPAILTVLPPTPPVILVHPRTQPVPEGQPLLLSVTATNLLPLRYQWHHDTVEIPGATNQSYRINAAALTDAGAYSVIVSTIFLSTTSAPAGITIAPPGFPSFVEQPADQAVNEGQTASLSVVARGEEPVRIQWLFEGIELPGATNATLSLENVSITRAGTYTVVVRNALGEVTSHPAVLTVIPGRLDTGFGAPEDLLGSTTTRIATQGAHKVLAASGFGWEHREHRLLRLESNGSLDHSFQSPLLDNYFGSFVVQSDDKILLGGGFMSVSGIPRQFIARLEADGVVDPSFLADAVVDFGILAVQPDGKILVNHYLSKVIRLNSDGTLDTTFVPDLPQNSHPTTLIVLPDGRIVMNTVDDSSRTLEDTLVRMDATGVRDPGFNVRLSPKDQRLAIATQGDGKLVIGGNFSLVNETAATNLVRINTDGTIDAAFQPGATTPPVAAVAIDTSGKILVGGGIPGGLFRLNADGSLDSTFQVDTGPVSTIVVQDDGMILIGGGFTQVDGVPRPGLARLFGSNPLPRISSMIRIGPLVRLSVPTIPSNIYVLERCDVLGAEWTAVQSIDGNGEGRVLTDVNATAVQRFYRVRVQ